MKKIICSIVFFMSLSAFAFSQSGEKPQQRERKGFAKELNLSDEQKTKVKELNSTYKLKADELRKNSTLSKEDRRKQMKDLSDQKHNDMKKILNADQIAKLDARKDKRHDRPSINRDGKKQKDSKGNIRRGDRPMNHMYHCPIAALNLSDDQKAKVKELNKVYSEKRKALRDEQAKAFDGILTADQKVKLDSLKQAKPRMQNRHKVELPQDVKAKIDSLKQNFEKEKDAITKTRIAPAMQQQKIEELTKKFREDKRAILEEVYKKNRVK